MTENSICDMTEQHMKLLSKCNSGTEEAPYKIKKKKEAAAYPSCGLSSLPDAVVLSCLARVSKLDHPALSMVSKRYRSLMVSSELYDLRSSSMGRTENLLYVCLRTPPDPTLLWFVHTPTTRLVQIPLLPYMPWQESSVVLLNHGIYVIGGIVNGKPSSGVFLLDCRAHKWSQVPSMRAARAPAITGVVNGKIYVVGGCGHKYSSEWAEVFDPKMETWETLSVPEDVFFTFCLSRHCMVMDDKIYAVSQFSETICYSPGNDKWEQGSRDLAGGVKRGWCVVGKLLYSCHVSGTVLWCEPMDLEKSNPFTWKEVKGLESLQNQLSSSRMVHHVWGYNSPTLGFSNEFEDQVPGFKLCNSGRNILLYWDVLVGGFETLEIWCAEISLERRTTGGGGGGDDDIWGTVLSSNVVMTLDPLLYRFKALYSLSVKV
ncbi:putative F-box/kelch-repeat protein At3g24610 [Brassica napus]|uniref:putative F-box/kelch-repeat protein At3g24610 n=1 Tax=Brassica napus TaxID=3708 RepID=UPI0006AA8F0E|nr:putative F-box/kelch-repeat protein At3g24610 [Brassica napus]